MAKTASRVVVFGSANHDHVLLVDAFPVPGQTVLASAYARSVGGKGANQAVAAARAGADVAFVATLGDDDSAAEILANLVAHRIDTRWIVRSQDQPTGAAVVLVDPAGANEIVVAPGANASFSMAAIDAVLRDIGPADVVVVQCEIPVPAVERVVRRGAERGARVILNLAPFIPLASEVLREVAILVVNESEARGVTGSAVEAVDLASEVASATGCLSVVTLGERGSVYAAPGERRGSIPAVEVDRVVDTTGAGDVYVGTLAAAVARGDDIGAAMAAASAAAARSVVSRGAQAGRPEPAVDAVG